MRRTFNRGIKSSFRQNVWTDVKENVLTCIFRSFKDYIYKKPVTFSGTFILSYIAGKNYILPFIAANREHYILMRQGAFRFVSAEEGEAGNRKGDA